jgi:hypothetical protein
VEAGLSSGPSSRLCHELLWLTLPKVSVPPLVESAGWTTLLVRHFPAKDSSVTRLRTDDPTSGGSVGTEVAAGVPGYEKAAYVLWSQ